MGKLGDSTTFFQNLGGLHDARVDRLSWLPGERRMSVLVDDIHSNAFGLEEYRGPTPAEFVFDDVESMDVDFQLINAALTIYELEVEARDGKLNASIRLAPGGKISLVCKEIAMHERRR